MGIGKAPSHVWCEIRCNYCDDKVFGGWYAPGIVQELRDAAKAAGLREIEGKGVICPDCFHRFERYGQLDELGLG